MEALKTISRPCFSCGSEAADWIAHNCDCCIKSSRMKKNGDYTKCRCSIQNDIFKQMFGYGNEEIRITSYIVCREQDCVYKKEHYPARKRKVKENPNQLKLFNDEI